MKMYTMHDMVKQEATGIMLFNNDDEAWRSFQFSINQIGKDSVTQPDDFELRYCGEFNENEGVVIDMDFGKVSPNLKEV